MLLQKHRAAGRANCHAIVCQVAANEHMLSNRSDKFPNTN